MDDDRMKAIKAGANMSSGGTNYNYVDAIKLERAGFGKYGTKKPGGNNFIRMVAPSKKGAFAKEVWIHSNVGSNGSVFICMDRTFGEPCAVCDHIKELKAANAADSAVKDIAPGRRFLVFVVDTTSKETEDEGPKWFDCPPSIYKEVCNLSKDKRTGATIDPTDPVNGRDIEFVRVDGNRTTYSGFKLEKTKPIPEEWYTGLPAYDEILLRPDYEDVKKAVSGRAPDSAEDDKSASGRREESVPAVEEDTGGRRSRRDVSDEKSTDNSNDENSDAVKAKLEEIKNRRRIED